MPCEVSQNALCSQYALALLDLDGVVYRGADPVVHAVEALNQSQQQGFLIAYTTNNSSRMPAVIAKQLRGYGLVLDDAQVVTSSIVAARMASKQYGLGAKVLAIGAEHLRDELHKQGLHVVDSAKDNPELVVQGWYPEITWNELAEAAYAVERGATYAVTNRDLTIPRELGVAPGCGSLIEAVICATGIQPVWSGGKPEQGMYDEALVVMENLAKVTLQVNQALAIGDRLDTDIEAANRGGYDSLLVLTGVTTAYDVMRALPKYRPTYISATLCGLLNEYIKPQSIGEYTVKCGDVTARFVDHCIQVEGDLNSIEALRAVSKLSWSLYDEGVEELTLPNIEIAIL